jgi:hypothetical protein
MSGFIFWFVLAIIFIFLWWAGFYATKDMRVRKNAMRTEQAKRNLERHAQQQAESTAEKTANESEDKSTKEQH